MLEFVRLHRCQQRQGRKSTGNVFPNSTLKTLHHLTLSYSGSAAAICGALGLSSIFTKNIITVKEELS